MQLFLYFANNYYQFFNVIRNKSLKLDTYINRQKIKSKQSTKLKEEEIEIMTSQYAGLHPKNKFLGKDQHIISF